MLKTAFTQCLLVDLSIWLGIWENRGPGDTSLRSLGSSSPHESSPVLQVFTIVSPSANMLSATSHRFKIFDSNLSDYFSSSKDRPQAPKKGTYSYILISFVNDEALRQ
jgi:hypothetical protein